MAAVGEQYTKNKQTYTIVKINNTEFEYIYLLKDGDEDVGKNYMCYGKKVFQQLFNKKEES